MEDNTPHPGSRTIEKAQRAIEELEYFRMFRNLGANDKARIDFIDRTIREMQAEIVNNDLRGTGVVSRLWRRVRGK